MFLRRQAPFPCSSAVFPFCSHSHASPTSSKTLHLLRNGGFVPFVVAESTTATEFNHLIGGDCVQLHSKELERLVPELLPPSNGDDVCKQQPLMAIQVTIFPNVGFSVGVAFSHMVADGRAFAHFTKSWAAICSKTLKNSPPPDYNSRDLIQDPLGIWSIFLKQIADSKPLTISYINHPTDNVRISPVLTKSHVVALKNWVLRKFVEENENDEPRLSTFVVSIAFIWVCLIKLHQTSTNKTCDDHHGICSFVFSADCRERLRLPTNYFGNCLRPCIASAKTSETIAENGIFMAAKAIGREIRDFEKEPLKGAESWLSRSMEKFKGSEHFAALAGSPKLRVYETDFGFGRPIKSDVVHIGSQLGAISMAETRDEEGGVEFGLAIPLDELHKFNVIFDQGLLNLE